VFAVSSCGSEHTVVARQSLAVLSSGVRSQLPNSCAVPSTSGGCSSSLYCDPIAVSFDVYVAVFALCRRGFEAEKGREVLEREDCIDNEADRQRHAKLTHRLNKLDLALLQAHSTVLLMEQF
jgi:hypothetical protein